MELTKGLLDGLMISPTVGADGRIVSLLLTVDTLPGMRVVLDGAAGREVRDALIALYAGEPYAQGDDRTLPESDRPMDDPDPDQVLDAGTLMAIGNPHP